MNASLLFIDSKLAIDLVGYLGMAIVLASFLLTNQKWLRAVNMIGGILSLVYGILSDQPPTALLNASLVTINAIYLVRTILAEKKNNSVNLGEDNAYNQTEECEE